MHLYECYFAVKTIYMHLYLFFICWISTLASVSLWFKTLRSPVEVNPTYVGNTSGAKAGLSLTISMYWKRRDKYAEVTLLFVYCFVDGCHMIPRLRAWPKWSNKVRWIWLAAVHQSIWTSNCYRFFYIEFYYNASVCLKIVVYLSVISLDSSDMWNRGTRITNLGQGYETPIMFSPLK
jgi:hypothetical protein